MAYLLNETKYDKHTFMANTRPPLSDIIFEGYGLLKQLCQPELFPKYAIKLIPTTLELSPITNTQVDPLPDVIHPIGGPLYVSEEIKNLISSRKEFGCKYFELKTKLNGSKIERKYSLLKVENFVSAINFEKCSIDDDLIENLKIEKNVIFYEYLFERGYLIDKNKVRQYDIWQDTTAQNGINQYFISDGLMGEIKAKKLRCSWHALHVAEI